MINFYLRKNDYENFLCALLLPKQARNAVIALRAFNVEVSKAAIASKDPRISLMRLGFWNETIEKIYEGNPPNHPVALQLARVRHFNALCILLLSQNVNTRVYLLGLNSFMISV